MTFSWVDFFYVAEVLSQSESYREAACRTAVNRAYHAAFCLARSYSSRHFGYNFSGKMELDDLREFIVANGMPIMDCISELDMLEQWRFQCDHHDEIDDIDELTTNALQTSHEVIELIKSSSSVPTHIMH